MSRYKQFRRRLKQQWRPVVVGLVLVLGPLGLFTFRLASHTRGILPEEQTYIDDSASMSQVMQSPSFMPHRLAIYGFQKLGIEHILYYRLISVVIGIIAVWSFYYVVQRWYTRRVALIGTILFSTSSLVLHATRTALPDVLLLGMLTTIAVGLWLQRTKRRVFALYVFIATLVMTVYIPGLMWVGVAALVWQGRRLVRAVGRQRLLHKFGLIVLPSVLLVPAIVSVALHPVELLTIAGLPTHLASLSAYGSHVKDSIQGLVWGYQSSPSRWVPGTPIFDVITLTMIVLGIYSLRFERKLRRSRIQLGILTITGLLVLSTGPVTMVALAPMFYLLATGGFAFMLQQWFTVFPRNPFARVVAIICISSTVLGVTIYQSYRYFTVWPNHPDVRVVLSDRYLIK
ncbi:glycosyltransferase family 39 protein [Candidatus Saccharibacteria bacterium]|nr:glycosyltransferase family 39 protein [Candidatus Saccharibacteria bacterium]